MKNTRRFLAVLIAILMIVPAVTVGISADEECTHTWVETSKIPAECTTDGVINYECILCHATTAVPLPATGHNGSMYYEDGSLKFQCVSCGEIISETVTDVNANTALSYIEGGFVDYDSQLVPAEVMTGAYARADGSITFLAQRPADIMLPTIAVASSAPTTFANAGVEFNTEYNFKLNAFPGTGYNNNISYVYTPSPLTTLNDQWTLGHSSRGAFGQVVANGEGGLVVVLSGAADSTIVTTGVTVYLIMPSGNWFRYDFMGDGCPCSFNTFKGIDISFETTTDWEYNEELGTYPWVLNINGTRFTGESLYATYTWYEIDPNGDTVTHEDRDITKLCDLTYFAQNMADGYSSIVVPGSFDAFTPEFTLKTLDGVAANEIATAHTHAYTSEITTPATCGADGVMTYTCDCGDTYTEVIPATGNHTYDSGVITTPATLTTTGVKTFTCTVCGNTYTEEIPVLVEEGPVLSAKNYTVTCTNLGTDYKVIRFAKGTYSSVSAIKNAVGARSLSGTKVYEGVDVIVDDGGTYTFYFQKNDGTGVFKTVEIGNMIPDYEIRDLYIVINNVYGASRVTVAPGHYTTHKAARGALGARSASSTISGKSHEFLIDQNYLGEYTIVAEYADGRIFFFYDSINVSIPTATMDGKTMTLSNLQDVNIVRYALGSYTSSKQIKSAVGAKSFRIAAGNETFDRFLAYDGTYTVYVKYTNGYETYLTVTVDNTDPTFAVDGSTIVVGNLNGMATMRYAPGTYTTDKQIKSAPGNKLVRGTAVAADGTYTITGLAAGTYTFYTYYDNLSSGIYTVTVD